MCNKEESEDEDIDNGGDLTGKQKEIEKEAVEVGLSRGGKRGRAAAEKQSTKRSAKKQRRQSNNTKRPKFGRVVNNLSMEKELRKSERAMVPNKH